MQKPKRPEGVPVKQPGDDVGPPYVPDGEASAQPESIGGDAADTLRDPDVERRRRERESQRRE